MIDYIQAWQCIGCGKIEAPQPCIGVCRDRKVLMVSKDDHQRVLESLDVLRDQAAIMRRLLLRLAGTTPHDDGWQASWLAVQAQARKILQAQKDATADAVLVSTADASSLALEHTP